MKGLDALQRHLKDAQRAFDRLEGEHGSVVITGSDPASIETAVAQMEQDVDKRMRAHRSNPFVAKIGAALKERYALAIRQRGQEAIAEFEHQSALREHQMTEEVFMQGNSGDLAPPTEKDAQRYLVLSYFYQYNEQRGADELWSEHAANGLRQQGHEIAHGDVARAMTYLSDKGLLRVTGRQGYISGEETTVRGMITARGVDAIERPHDFRGVLSQQVINYIVQGSVNVAHGDQQVVGHYNSGVVAQGKARVEQRIEAPAFPAEAVRAELADHPDAVAAIDTLAQELQSERPRASVVTATIETIKNVANIAEIGKAFSAWLADPTVQQHLAMIAASSFHL